LAIVVPTYNEARSLPGLVEELQRLPLWGSSALIVVDDASPDGTGAVADSLAATAGGRIHVVHRPRKGGLGSAYRAGFGRALELGASRVVQMDADSSHSPRDVPRLVAGAEEGADLVIGSRYVRGGSIDERWSAGRRFLSWWANHVWVRAVLGTAVRDATSGFRCWRSEALADVLRQEVRSQGYVFLVEMAYVAERRGYRIAEAPIRFEERYTGTSKMDTRIKIEAAWRVFEIRRRHRGLTPASS
jgi:dolichol-phosphate mannosyltransferase